jgi:hypothetical protein
VVPAKATDLYTPIAVNAKEAVINCIQPPTMEIATKSFDGILSTNSKYNTTITYDAKEHPFVVTAKDTKTKRAVEATVKYLALTARWVETTTQAGSYHYYDAEGKDITDKVESAQYMSDMPFEDTCNLKTAGTYAVFVELSLDGYTTTYPIAEVIKINPYDTKAKITVSKQYLTYGEELYVTTGSSEIDEMIGLTFENTSKMPVGRYAVTDLVSWDNVNYTVAWGVIGENDDIVIEKRNATILLQESSSTYDGKEVDKSGLFTIEGLVNDDDLEVIVSTAGNIPIIDAGDYTLVATANNSNYNIEKVTATYTVNPASIKGATVTPKKTSMVWTGKALKPGVASVVLADGTELATTDYSVAYSNNTNVGTAKITVKGKGNYTGTATATFKITKAKQKVKSVSPTKKTIAAGKSFKITAKATKEQGTAQFKKTSGNKNITIASNGKVTVKKGTKAGKYTIKYKVRIKATKNCKRTAWASKKLVITVK